ncbi:MAG: hypothetical protein ACF8Q5_12145 [Phycisphaerales bacterium JB040]
MRITPTTAVLLAAASAALHPAHADLIGVNYSTGAVFSIDEHTASATELGELVRGVMGIASAPDGMLYAITDGISGQLLQIDPGDWSANPVGGLGAGFTFEGGLAFDGAGHAIGGSRLAGGGRGLFEIDLATGSIGHTIVLDRTAADLNGLHFRDDGVLVGIDGDANEFVSVDLVTGEVTTIAALITPDAGSVGGLTALGDVGYYVTAGTVSGSDGDNALYRIDLHTGSQTRIGTLGPDAGSGFGIGGLVGVVPTPGGAALLGLGGLIATRRRRN